MAIPAIVVAMLKSLVSAGSTYVVAKGVTKALMKDKLKEKVKDVAKNAAKGALKSGGSYLLSRSGASTAGILAFRKVFRFKKSLMSPFKTKKENTQEKTKSVALESSNKISSNLSKSLESINNITNNFHRLNELKKELTKNKILQNKIDQKIRELESKKKNLTQEKLALSSNILEKS